MAYKADLNSYMGSAPLASQGDTTHTQNQNVTQGSGGDKTVLHIAVAVVVVAIIVLLIGRGYLRNARIA